MLPENEDKPDTSDKSTDTPADDKDSEEGSEDTEAEGTSDTEANDEEEGEDISKQYFTDPSSLPKELRVAFKKMQGKFTKKMQEASSRLDQAEAFELLTRDPSFIKWAEARRAGNDDTETDTEEEDTSDDDKPLTRKQLAAELAKLQEKNKSELDQEKMRIQFEKEAAQFKENHPDWELHREDMKQLLKKHPTLSYEELYALATRNEDQDSKKQALVDAKRRANTRKPGGTGGKDVETGKPKKFGSVREAAEWTIKQLNKNRK